MARHAPLMPTASASRSYFFLAVLRAFVDRFAVVLALVPADFALVDRVAVVFLVAISFGSSTGVVSRSCVSQHALAGSSVPLREKRRTASAVLDLSTQSHRVPEGCNDHPNRSSLSATCSDSPGLAN